jgi:formylglycine-generating enzyme required for sulfatase activity
VLRGGCFRDVWRRLRVAERSGNYPDYGYNPIYGDLYVGFRCVSASP